ncbi:uncharacterized protein F5147DRAFT_658824 [Suillus discolor]|uniref:Uncharacterized protein n=1 Tax=Suillus discolor TaxID=1912936 RepID=A0A9P7ET87_9AGAM|nr:uncharacterized protein F5147DRAFT_658824 [Suillus discolor]KAG2088017.1 hypothetical protein F5147DRAFT_658824 [Suillus discolor]
MYGVAAPIAHNFSPLSAILRCIARPAPPYSTAAVAYLTAVKKKCEGWLRTQHVDLTPAKRLPLFKCQLYPNALTSSVIHQFTVMHLECRTLVIVNPIDPSFCLLSTWVPPGIQDALNEARKAELCAQAGLMAMYLDIDGYNSHQCNTSSELLYLQARMNQAKAEVEVYELAIENAPASNFSDNGIDTPAALSSSLPCPNPPPLLPEDVCHYKEYINAKSLDDSSSEHLCYLPIFINMKAAPERTSIKIENIKYIGQHSTSCGELTKALVLPGTLETNILRQPTHHLVKYRGGHGHNVHWNNIFQWACQ